MSLRLGWIAAGACVVLSLPRTGGADESREPGMPMAVGFNLDVLPTALSAANGRLGYAPQVWLGIGHARIRFVAAHIELPDALAFAPKGFRHPTTTVFASIIDYTFGSHFDGAWGSAIGVLLIIPTNQ